MVAALMLRASSDILSKANDELLHRECTPLQLANELSLAVQLVENFLNGEIVDRNTHNLICEKLNISLNTLPENHESTNRNEHSLISENAVHIPNSNNNVALTNPNQSLIDGTSANLQMNIDELLQAIRRNISAALICQCDRFRTIDINNPLCLHDLYTDINIFTDLQSSQYLDLNEAFANIPPEQYDRFYLAKLQPAKIPANQALEKHKQILLVGSLGSGKTTLLKYWAMACIAGKILPKYLPVFLPLRSLISFDDLRGIKVGLKNSLMWLKKQLTNYGVPDGLLDNKLFEQLLIEGRLLLLWDGLDETPEMQRSEIAQQILNFSDRYPKNRMVCSTRNPIYAHILQSFQTLEIAPFQESQIATFASKWFQTTCPQKPNKLEKFQQLLATDQPLAEIASHPLFLTYLCTAFNSCEYLKPNFYQEILNLLLTSWERTKCLPSLTNQALSISQKQDLLSYIAIISLDRHGYVWQNVIVQGVNEN
jgi:predicted NACHT family NTPase